MDTQEKNCYSGFPRTLPETQPHEAQMAKEVWEFLGCKDPLTRAFIRACFVAIRVFDYKQGKYGTGNIAKKGAKGVVTRMWDKVSRLDNIYEKGKQDEAESETVEDTFGDCANYGLIALMCRWKQWPGSPEGADSVIRNTDSN